MKTSTHRIFCIAIVGSLAACGSAPLSFLDGEPKTKTEALLYPVKVISVDGAMEFRNPVQVAPGPRWLVLEAAPSAGARKSVQKSFVIRVEPCTRYFLAAKRATVIDADWQVVIDAKEQVPGCDVEAEKLKAAPKGSSYVSPRLPTDA